MLARIETKVWAAMGGTGAGATLSAAVVWALGVFVWHASSDASAAQSAIDAVPAPVAALVALALTVLGTFVGGYAAPASNHAGNNATGAPMDDTTAGHDHIDPAAAVLAAGALDDDTDDTFAPAQEG